MKLFYSQRHTRLSGFNGNIDGDSIKPAINTAQTTQVKGFGAKLYNKISTTADTLTGDYQRFITTTLFIYRLSLPRAFIYRYQLIK
jgi:hypothetical protein